MFDKPKSASCLTFFWRKRDSLNHYEYDPFPILEQLSETKFQPTKQKKENFIYQILDETLLKTIIRIF